MSGARLRHLVRLRVERSDEARPLLTLDQIESGTGRMSGETPTAEPDGQIKFETGDVLFSKLRPYLAKSLVVQEPSHGTGELLAMIPSSGLDARYLLYVTLSKPWLDLADLTSYGTKMPRTSWEAMANYRFPVLPLEVQRRIADFLDDQTTRIDNIITARQQQLLLLDEWMQSALDAIFVPWKRTQLRNLASRVVVGIAEGATHAYADSGVPLFRSTNIHRNSLDSTDLLFIEPWFAKRNRTKTVRAGDILTVRTGNAGVSAVVPPEFESSQCFTQLITTPLDGQSSELICAALNAVEASRYFALHAWGTAQNNISVPLLANAPVPVIPLPQQPSTLSAVQSVLNESRSLRNVLEAQILLLEEARRSLISAAVSGEFDVSTADGSQVVA